MQLLLKLLGWQSSLATSRTACDNAVPNLLKSHANFLNFRYYGGASSSSSAVPSEYTAPYPASSAHYPQVYGTAVSASYPAHNTSGPYPTGGATHKITTSTAYVTGPTSPVTPPPAPSEPAGNGAASMAGSLAGLILAGGVAVLAL